MPPNEIREQLDSGNDFISWVMERSELREEDVLVLCAD
jgi:hypothetical protein